MYEISLSSVIHYNPSVEDLRSGDKIIYESWFLYADNVLALRELLTLCADDENGANRIKP